MPTPSDVLATMLRTDPGRPRITCYDDTPGPTAGERIELSAKVLANWVSKAANALQEEWDLGVGSAVRLDLPAHWRSLYWALATWSVGATVVLADRPGAGALPDPATAPVDLLVTDDADAAAAAGGPAVLVTLAALARQSGSPVPPDAMDEARELSAYADQFAAWDEPEGQDPAVRTTAGTTAYEDVVPRRDWPAQARVHVAGDDLAELLEVALAAWAVDGSVVLSRGPEPAAGRAARLEAEGVTLDLAGS